MVLRSTPVRAGQRFPKPLAPLPLNLICLITVTYSSHSCFQSSCSFKCRKEPHATLSFIYSQNSCIDSEKIQPKTTKKQELIQRVAFGVQFSRIKSDNEVKMQLFRQESSKRVVSEVSTQNFSHKRCVKCSLVFFSFW